MHFTCFIFNIDFYKLSLICNIHLYIYMDLKICVSMDFFYSINLCSCTYMKVLSSLYILNIALFVKDRALIKTCPSCIHTSLFFLYSFDSVYFFFIGKAFCNKATSTRCELLSEYFFLFLFFLKHISKACCF